MEETNPASEIAAEIDTLPPMAKVVALDNAATVHRAILALEAGDWLRAMLIAGQLAQLAEDVHRWASAKAKPSKMTTGECCDQCHELAEYCQCDATCLACGIEYPANLDCGSCGFADCEYCADCCRSCPECGCHPCECL